MEWTFVRNDTTGEGWTLQVSKAGRVAGRILHSDLDQLKAALKNLA